MGTIFQLLRTSGNLNANFDALGPPVIYSIRQILAGKDIFLKPSCFPGLIWVQRRFPALFLFFAKMFFMITKEFLKTLNMLLLLEKSLLGL